jgi:hypothetical protein
MSREEGQRKIGTLGYVDCMHGVSRGKDARRYDDADPDNAEGKNMLRLSREIGGIAAAPSSD